MTKQSLLELVFLLIISSFLTTTGILFYIQNPVEEESEIDYFSSLDMRCDLSKSYIPEQDIFIPGAFKINRELKRMLGELELSITRMIVGDSHRMFITAYCSAECGGSTMTSSGARVHRSSYELRYEPTTCAIDRNYFSYGDLFYVPSEDRIYIAEDTGSGVKGMWLDTYQESMSAVRGYNTRYETVYEVELEHDVVLASNYDVRTMIAEQCCGGVIE